MTQGGRRLSPGEPVSVAEKRNRFICQECGDAYPRWAGRCDACGAWNSIVEEAPRESVPKGLGAGRGRKIALATLAESGPEMARHATGIGEFDRVTGGGLVPGSALLVGGDPGIGKSTLLLQVASALSESMRCLYVSGEEAPGQIAMRAKRLGLAEAPVQVAAATNLRDILTTLEAADGPQLAVIDSIQTMYVDALDSAPGTVAQLRASAQELIRLAKRRGIVILLVGHVTKEGMIAGPKVLEHMVDTVLYFEGERSHQYRILRSVKNRFGATDEIGVFEMSDAGLRQVQDPSALFLTERDSTVSGNVVFAGVEGTRPVLVEIEALISPSGLATPRRAVVGWDSARLAMVLAVLEARCGLRLAGRDVYLNVAGGLRITEPAADLAVAAALVSSLTDRPVPARLVIFGEIGLSGEIRPVSRTDLRLKEAAKLGFAQAYLPARRAESRPGNKKAARLDLVEINHLRDLVAHIAGGAAD